MEEVVGELPPAATNGASSTLALRGEERGEVTDSAVSSRTTLPSKLPLSVASSCSGGEVWLAGCSSTQPLKYAQEFTGTVADQRMTS